jgi:hypothetical protein
MRQIAFIGVLIFIYSCGNGKTEIPQFPRFDRLPESARKRVNIAVHIDKNDIVTIGGTVVPAMDIDSVLYKKIDSLDPNSTQPVIVLTADTATNHIIVDQVRQISKRAGARVVLK